MKNIIKIIKKLILFIINLMILIISLFIPKSKKIAVVGGWFGERFADNSKHFYLYLNDNLNNLGFSKVVWITRSKEIRDELKQQGYQVYSAWSIFSIWYHLRARYHLIDQGPKDLNAFFSVRSKRINLWHGFPLKKIGSYTGLKQFNVRTKLQRLLNKLTTRGFWADHFILATSEFSAEILGKAFGVDNNRVIISGYPRNYETIVENPTKYISKNERRCFDMIANHITQGYKTIGYFPTFRDYKETVLFGTDESNELREFLDFCQQAKIKIVGKFHFAGKKDKFGEIKDHEAFINLSSEADVYTFLSQIDILITDYSSIYYDFLLWKKPIIFFPYDLKYFKNEDRGFIYDYDEFTPGDKVFNCKELKGILEDGVDRYTEVYFSKYSDKAESVARKIFSEYEEMTISHLIDRIREQ